MDTSSADYKRYQAWLAANPPPPAPPPPPKTIDQCLVEFQKCDLPKRVRDASPPAAPHVAMAAAPVTMAAVPPPPSKKYWGPQTGIDYPNNDLKVFPSSDPNACATACDANPQCVGYVLATDSQNCWLKSKFANPTPSNKRTASVKPGQPSPPGLPGRTSGYMMEGAPSGGIVSSKKEWTLIMILFVLAVLLWIIAKKM